MLHRYVNFDLIYTNNLKHYYNNKKSQIFKQKKKYLFAKKERNRKQNLAVETIIMCNTLVTANAKTK